MTDDVLEPGSAAEAKPLTRAQRLKAQALAASRDAEASAAAASRAHGRPAVRARELNRRIRDLVREHENQLYAAPTPDPEETPAKPTSSSWEDIANEVCAPTTAPRRGLATGAMRGGSVRNPDQPSSVPVWLPRPTSPGAILCELPAPSVPLHQALQGEEISCDTYGTHYRISRAAHLYDASFAALRDRMQCVLDGERFPALSGARLEDLLFVDIETTGLSPSQPLFLVGALGMDGESVLDLYLARDLPEEGALLAAFAEQARGKTLVTFNGKSFDWPYIEGRSRAHRVRIERPRAHLDLLHLARRHWRHALPNCKLQTLELYLCNRTRVDDVGGSLIPRTYHEFAARHAKDGTGAHLMVPILHHNALDILTMAELLCVLDEQLAGK